MKGHQSEAPSALTTLAKKDPTLQFRWDEELGVVRSLRGNLSRLKKPGTEYLHDAGVEFLQEHADLFGDVRPKKMRILDQSEDPNGGFSMTLQQYCDDHLVYGGSVRFHTDSDGNLDTINNRLFPDLEKVPSKARISEEEAVQAARTSTKCKSGEKVRAELLVYRHAGEAHLAWEVRLVEKKAKKKRETGSWLGGDHNAASEWIAYVDAISGKTLFFYDNVKTAGTVGAGTGQYSGAGGIDVWSTGATYQLRDTTRTAAGGPEIITDDEDGESPSEDPDNDWSDITAVPRDQNQGAEVDTHRHVGSAVDYFLTVHGRNSLDGAGMNVESVVHYLEDEDNAYWSSFFQVLRIGDGTGAAPGFDYLCSDDIVAHELTHGVIDFTCDLQYANESGALNEAISDIFAAFITGDWMIGEDCWINPPPATALRNMSDPTNGGLWDSTDPITSVLAGHQPSHYSVRYTGIEDYGGVHINSGIINNLFYLLTVGGTHTVSGITVAGIGQSAAEQILYRVISVNLIGNPTADFLDFREATLEACLELFPTDLFKLTQVKRAFNAVGIGPDIYVRDNVVDTGEEPYPGTSLYASPDIINRVAVSADPAADFADLTDGNLWENVEYGQDNFVYVRLQNRGPEVGDATINVYFTAASSFGVPTAWTHVGTLAETGISPGDVRLAGPLTFEEALIPAPGHYCMIAVISDSLDPAPDHNLITSVSDYLDFVRDSNNIAYRNMDVVDLVPLGPGAARSIVRGLPGTRERFDLRFDVHDFVPGAKLRVRGPAKALDGAIPKGLKLVARERDENVYEVPVGGKWRTLKRFGYPFDGRVDNTPGFDKILIEQDFEVAVEYVLPKEEILKKSVRRLPREGYGISIRQLWKGELVGAVGIRGRA